MDNFFKNIISIGGQEGQQWLETLPTQIKRMAEKWGLIDLTPATSLSYNYILLGRQASSDSPIVLKLSLDKKGLRNEYLALQHYAGQGCIKVLDADLNLGALLLEQAIPGVSLASLFPENDAAAVEHAVSVMTYLHRTPLKNAEKARTIADWLKALQRSQNLPEAPITKAQLMAESLLNTVSSLVLLHGDLHHDNILASQRGGWLAIDPKGVIGEPAYEVGAFIRNPMPALLSQPNIRQIISHRLDLFSTLLRMDKQRLKDWSYVQAILAACWMVEDNLDPMPLLRVVEIIEGL